MQNTKRRSGLRRSIGTVSIILFAFSTLLVLIAHQGGPPLWTSLTMIILPVAFLLAAVDCLGTLGNRLRRIIALYILLTACVYAGLSGAMLLDWVRGDLGFALIPALLLVGYLGALNRPWRQLPQDRRRGG